MNLLPPMPTWEGAHPILVHLPIGVLVFAPVLLIIAAVDAKRRKVWACSALAAMLFGTLFAFLAVMTGEEAAEHVVVSAQVEAVMEHHEELGEAARTVFAALTGVFAAILLVGTYVKKKWARPAVTIGSVLFGLGYLYGLGLLANTGHEGGRLVHQFGVHAPVAQGSANSPARPADDDEHEDDDD
ncbi:MAG: putative membrane protein [Phycisphaerales bacterium]|jgi:uncharacterized membrane protein